MFIITEQDSTQRMSDTLMPICVASNGCYIPASGSPDGFVVMTPTIVEDMEGNPMQTVETRVYALPGHHLNGGEPEALYIETPAVPIITELDAALEEAYELLYGGIDDE